MARKKQEFDPLAGPIGGSGLRKKKSKGKSFDVLGGGFGGDHPVEKEAFDSYADVSFGRSSDALMETCGGSSPRSKPGKKGLFASIFGGGGKKKQQKPQRESMPLEAEEERPESYVPKHVRDPELEVQDGVMETGIVDGWWILHTTNTGNRSTGSSMKSRYRITSLQGNRRRISLKRKRLHPRR